MLGRIVGVFGIKGWVKLKSYTRPPEAVFGYSPWGLGLETGWQRKAVLDAQAKGNGLIAKLEGIDDRDMAGTLVGSDIAVARTELPQAEQGAVYWADLVGCTVINHVGVDFGKITSLMETGANDVMVVNNGRERLIPYIEEVIESVDLDTRSIRVRWDEDF